MSFYLNKNYSNQNNAETNLLSDLEFDISTNTDKQSFQGGNNSDSIARAAAANTTVEEYTDLLLPKLISNYSTIKNNSTEQEIENDINSTIEQNMSLKTLEEIYGKRKEDNLENEENKTDNEINEEKDEDDEDVYNFMGGNDRELDASDEDTDNENEEDEEDEYPMDYDFDDVDAINDEDVQEEPPKKKKKKRKQKEQLLSSD